MNKSAAQPSRFLVGRDEELNRLQACFERALQGDRQCLLITGESGIGKTTLVDTFLERVAPSSVLIGRGQCVERFGLSDAYRPLLAAVGDLVHGSARGRVVTLLRQHAPSWLLQLPDLVSADEQAALERSTHGTTPEHVVRQLAILSGEIGSIAPLIIVIEDLHWSDLSTLDALAALSRGAERDSRARILLIGTCRPAEIGARGRVRETVREHLVSGARFTELPLSYLGEPAVSQYLAARFPGHPFDQRVANAIHRRTTGNPLFLVNVTEHLAARWAASSVEVVDAEVPPDLRDLIERQLQRLTPVEQRVLEGASVVGMRFAGAAAAAAVQNDPAVVEELLDGLTTRQQFVRFVSRTRWLDGTTTGLYEFVHALYQQVLLDRIPAARLERAHRRIGERLQIGFGAHAAEIAADLAVHFEQGAAPLRAIEQLRQAGQSAVRRSAYREANDHFTRGLQLAAVLPERPNRMEQELLLLIAMARAQVLNRGYGEVGDLYRRALPLCEHAGGTLEMASVLHGLGTFHLMRGELEDAARRGEELRALHGKSQASSPRDSGLDTTLLFGWGHLLGLACFWQGKLPEARAHFEAVAARYDPTLSDSLTHYYNHDVGLVARGYLAMTLWMLGYPDQAARAIDDAAETGRQLGDPGSLGFLTLMAAQLHGRFRRDLVTAERYTAELLALSQERELLLYVSSGMVFQGWLRAQQEGSVEGVEVIQRGLMGLRMIGEGLTETLCLLMLAEAHAAVGHVEQGLDATNEALVASERMGMGLQLTLLLCLKGTLLLQLAARLHPEAGGGPQLLEGQACLRHALQRARQQQTKSAELRAASTLSRLLERQGQRAEARELLSGVFRWFGEGFGTADLQEAKAQLEGLEEE